MWRAERFAHFLFAVASPDLQRGLREIGRARSADLGDGVQQDGQSETAGEAGPLASGPGSGVRGNSAYAKKFAPDAVLCTHFLPVELLGRLRQKWPGAPPLTASIVTDFRGARAVDGCQTGLGIRTSRRARNQATPGIDPQRVRLKNPSRCSRSAGARPATFGAAARATRPAENECRARRPERTPWRRRRISANSRNPSRLRQRPSFCSSFGLSVLLNTIPQSSGVCATNFT